MGREGNGGGVRVECAEMAKDDGGREALMGTTEAGFICGVWILLEGILWGEIP